MCLLSNDIYDYYIVSQGKTTIPNVDDGEECTLTDVSPAFLEPKARSDCNVVPSLRRKQPDSGGISRLELAEMTIESSFTIVLPSIFPNTACVLVIVTSSHQLSNVTVIGVVL